MTVLRTRMEGERRYMVIWQVPEGVVEGYGATRQAALAEVEANERAWRAGESMRGVKLDKARG